MAGLLGGDNETVESTFKGADGKSYRWIDADTFTDGNKSYRIQGYNAPEKQKVFKDDEDLPRFKAGQLGGIETQRAVEKIVAEGGFNNIEFSGKTDSFGRERVKLLDQDGNDLTNALYKSGAVDINLFTDEEGLQAAERGKFLKEIGAKGEFDHIIEDELSEIQNKPLQFKDNAINEQEYLDGVVQTIALQQGLNLADEEDYRTAMSYALDANYDMRSIPFSGIDFRAQDRTKEGVAYNQTTEAWNQGWRGMGAGLAGFAELIGVTLGSEEIETWGRNKVDDAKADLLSAPIIRNLDYRDVDSIWDGLDFMINNTAMSAPYMTTLVAGGLLAPVTGGASAVIAYSSTGASYAGQVWNDIEGEKGRAEAVGSIMAGTAMAVLDRLAMSAFMKPSELLTKAGRQALAEGISATKNVTLDQAKRMILNATKAETKALISGLNNFAADNINNSQIMRELLKASGRGFLAEGVTEMAQEGLGYSASTAMSEGRFKENFNPNEFTNLLLQAGIAGGTIGGSLGVAGATIEAGDRYAMQKGYMLGDISKVNPYDKVMIDFNDQRTSISDIAGEASAATEGYEMVSSQSITKQRAGAGKTARGSFMDKLKDPTKYPELTRTSATSAFRPEDLRLSSALRKLYALVGQPFGKLYSGRDVQAEESAIKGQLSSIFDPVGVFKRFGFKDNLTNSTRISNMIREVYPKLQFTRDRNTGEIVSYTIPKGTQLDKELVTYMDAIVETIKDLDMLNEREFEYRNMAYTNQDLGRLETGKGLDFDRSGWLNRGVFDWKKVRNNREAWYKWMRENTDYGKPENKVALDDLYNRVSNNENATDFSIVEGVEYVPGRTKEGLDLASVPGFEEFANTDIIQNALNSVGETSKYYAYTTYFGAGGKHIDYFLNEAKKDGVSDETLNHIAYFTKSIIDAGTGNYNPIKNRKLAFMQRQAAFYSAMVGLPLAMISSVPEFVMAVWQAKDMRDVRNAVVAATGELKNIMQNVSAMEIHGALFNVPRAHIDNKAQKRLTKIGHLRDSAGVATRLGMGETDITTAWWQKNFYKWVGIAGITNFQRCISAALATSFISDRVRMLAANLDENGNIDIDALSQEKLDVYLQLRNLGMDVEGIVGMFNKYNGNQKMFDAYMDDEYDANINADSRFIDDQLNTAIWYFVNDRVQNPQAYNRPLFFQDPRFQLIVQFNGFLSTFTANIIPRLWKDYVAKGSPRMQYNTFAMVVTLMAFAGASQWLKDFIKFGGSTPYLNDYQLLQRAIQSAGLLGTGERVLQMGLPMYQSRDQGLVERLFGETVGGAPTLRNIGTGVKAIQALGQGETERAVNHGLKLVPGVGTTPVGRNWINDKLHSLGD